MLEGILNPIFNPLLGLGYFWAIFIMSFLITLMVTVIYKFATDQSLMKKLKSEMKSMQKEMKKLKDKPDKAMKYQKKIMQKNMEYMKHSLKPTLYTFIPIIIIFGWLNAHMAYQPIMPNTAFNVTAHFQSGSSGEITLQAIPELSILSNPTQLVDGQTVTWTLEGDSGDYQLLFNYNNREFEKDLIITNGRGYAPPEKPVEESNLKQLVIQNKDVKPLNGVSLFGWKPGWLGTYIIFSLIFSFVLRKLLKIS